MTSFYTVAWEKHRYKVLHVVYVRGPFERFVDWRQCAAVMQREVVTVTPSCNGGGKVVVALSSYL
jgi:hypothetical protein